MRDWSQSRSLRNGTRKWRKNTDLFEKKDFFSFSGGLYYLLQQIATTVLLIKQSIPRNNGGMEYYTHSR
ncbi:hypothetical protein ACROYT_G037895 [Oculina patagonica]